MKPKDVYTATVFSPDAEILVRASTATAPELGMGSLFFTFPCTARELQLFLEQRMPSRSMS